MDLRPLAVMVTTAPSDPDDLVAEIESIYRRRIAALRRFARAVLGDAELAYDAVQDGFVRALRDCASFRGEASLEGWVWGCVMNAIRESGRTFGKQRRPFPQHARPTSIEARGQDEVIRTAVRRLPERQRLALFLRHYADLDYAEIAEALGIATGTVSATLHAAHAALRTALEGDDQ